MRTLFDPNAVYIAPSGRRCRWVPPDSANRARTAYSFFQYADRDSAVRDGFNLTPPNYRLMRKEGEHATAR